MAVKPGKSVTARVNTEELGQLMWSLDDVATRLAGSPKPVVRAAVKTLRMVAGRLFQAAGVDVNGPKRPRIVCLCGSTRFWKQFQEASLQETLAGKIVLSVGAAVASDAEHFGHLSPAEQKKIKTRLDELHMRKIDLADEVLILNVDGYVGESTSRELEYARAQGKLIRFLEAADGSRNDDRPQMPHEPTLNPLITPMQLAAIEAEVGVA